MKKKFCKPRNIFAEALALIVNSALRDGPLTICRPDTFAVDFDELRAMLKLPKQPKHNWQNGVIKCYIYDEFSWLLHKAADEASYIINRQALCN